MPEQNLSAADLFQAAQTSMEVLQDLIDAGRSKDLAIQASQLINAVSQVHEQLAAIDDRLRSQEDLPELAPDNQLNPEEYIKDRQDAEELDQSVFEEIDRNVKADVARIFDSFHEVVSGLSPEELENRKRLVDDYLKSDFVNLDTRNAVSQFIDEIRKINELNESGTSVENEQGIKLVASIAHEIEQEQPNNIDLATDAIAFAIWAIVKWSYSCSNGGPALDAQLQGRAAALEVGDNLPVLVVDYAEMAETALNIWHAHEAGWPEVLTYDDRRELAERTERETTRERRSRLGRKRQDNLETIDADEMGVFRMPSSRKVWRDEYPFACTIENDGSTWVGPASAKEQKLQADQIRQFLIDHGAFDHRERTGEPFRFVVRVINVPT